MPNDLYQIQISEGVYTFVTDNKLAYACQFLDVTHMLSPIVGVYDIQVLDFEFTTDGKQKHDPRVGATIKELMRDAFSDNKRAILFLCDNSDNRAKVRHKLFKQWADDPEFHRDNLEIEAEEQVLLGSLLTHKSFPYRDVLEKDVIEPVKGFAIQKFDG